MSTRVRVQYLTRSRRNHRVRFNYEHTFDKFITFFGLQALQVFRTVPPPLAFSMIMEILFLCFSYLRTILLWLALSLLLLYGFNLLPSGSFLLEEKICSTVRTVPLEIFKVPSVVTNILTSSGTMHSSLFI